MAGFSSALNLAQTENPVFADIEMPYSQAFDEDSWYESTVIPEGAAFTTFTTAKVVKAKTDEDPRANSPTQPAYPVRLQRAKTPPPKLA